MARLAERLEVFVVVVTTLELGLDVIDGLGRPILSASQADLAEPFVTPKNSLTKLCPVRPISTFRRSTTSGVRKRPGFGSDLVRITVRAKSCDRCAARMPTRL